MAIIDRLPGVEVRVCSIRNEVVKEHPVYEDGEAADIHRILREYPCLNNDDDEHKPDVVNYIELAKGQTFSIWVSLNEPFVFEGCDGIGFEIRVDGKRKGFPCFRKEVWSRYLTPSGNVRQKIRENRTIELPSVDVANSDSDQATLQGNGDIVVLVHRIKLTSHDPTNNISDQEAEAGIGSFSSFEDNRVKSPPGWERKEDNLGQKDYVDHNAGSTSWNEPSASGTAENQRNERGANSPSLLQQLIRGEVNQQGTNLGGADATKETVRPKIGWSHLDGRHNRPFVIFKFQYRSREALRALRILEPSPTPNEIHPVSNETIPGSSQSLAVKDPSPSQISWLSGAYTPDSNAPCREPARYSLDGNDTSESSPGNSVIESIELHDGNEVHIRGKRLRDGAEDEETRSNLEVNKRPRIRTAEEEEMDREWQTRASRTSEWVTEDTIFEMDEA